jgi:hypothetical protein
MLIKVKVLFLEFAFLAIMKTFVKPVWYEKVRKKSIADVIYAKRVGFGMKIGQMYQRMAVHRCLIVGSVKFYDNLNKRC